MGSAVKAKDIVMDGKCSNIPGFAGGARSGDELLFVFQSGTMDGSNTSTPAANVQIAPCDLTIIGGVYNKTTSGASKTLNFGTVASNSAYLAALALQDAAGIVEIPASAFIETKIAKGSPLMFSSAALTSTTVYVGILAVARNG